LRLGFGSNTLWRKKGWFVAAVDPLVDDPASAQFVARWDGDLSWSWPWGQAQPLRFVVEHRDDPAGGWSVLADEVFVSSGDPAHYVLQGGRILSQLDGSPRRRHELRVIGWFAQGKVATRGVVVFPDGGDGQPLTLSLPWPNPARDSVRFMVEIPVGGQGRLGLFDLRGRCLWDRTLAGGSRLIEWDGRDRRGARAAAGTYIIRLEGSGQVVRRKVVLIH
jgi:hypothetical protein